MSAGRHIPTLFVLAFIVLIVTVSALPHVLPNGTNGCLHIITISSESNTSRPVTHNSARQVTVSRRKSFREQNAPASQASNQLLLLSPQGVAALIGIITLLGTSILCFAGWRIWVLRRRIANSKHAARHELPQPFADVVVISGSPQATMPRDDSQEELTSERGSWTEVATVDSAPASDTASATHPSLLVTPPPVYDDSLASPLIPRISSNTPVTTAIEPFRLVVVKSTFIIKFHDELKIREGEILRLLQEYDDGWCYVQRVGSQDARRGIVPRICVVDMSEAVSCRNS